MKRVIPIRTGVRAGTAARFIAIGLLLYALLFAGAEWLVYRNGRMNPIFKIETAPTQDFDWVILGASHAMPLDFDGFNGVIEARTGLKIINLAGPGTGPLYNRFVLEHFLRDHATRNVLYVADGFAVRSPMWNEERFSDAKLLVGTPFSIPLSAQLARYVVKEGVDPRAWLDYVTGFSKINNRERFRPDLWEGEASFDRTFKPSATADRKRAEYLYPDVGDEAARRARYLAAFSDIIELAGGQGADVTVIKPPLPSRFRQLLIGEPDFDEELRAIAERHGARLLDLSSSMDEPRFYADTDHLNRTGVAEYFERHLKEILTPDSASWHVVKVAPPSGLPTPPSSDIRQAGRR